MEGPATGILLAGDMDLHWNGLGICLVGKSHSLQQGLMSCSARPEPRVIKCVPHGALGFVRFEAANRKLSNGRAPVYRIFVFRLSRRRSLPTMRYQVPADRFL